MSIYDDAIPRPKSAELPVSWSGTIQISDNATTAYLIMGYSPLSVFELAVSDAGLERLQTKGQGENATILVKCHKGRFLFVKRVDL